MQVFGTTKCVICGRSFERHAPRSVCCGKECRNKHNFNRMHLWHKTHREYEKRYWTNRLPRSNIMRNNRRRHIYDIWGRNNDWRVAEYDAERILKLCGYRDIRRLDYIPTSPFDIVATSVAGLLAVFQITTRTHTSKKKAHKLAKDLGLHHMVLFISPTAKIFIIKDFSVGGLAELNEGEVKSASRYA